MVFKGSVKTGCRALLIQGSQHVARSLQVAIQLKCRFAHVFFHCLKENSELEQFSLKSHPFLKFFSFFHTSGFFWGFFLFCFFAIPEEGFQKHMWT